MNNRTLKDKILDLSDMWLKSSNLDFTFKIQCREFPDVVKNSADEDDLLFNVLDYCKKFTEDGLLTPIDSKRFIACVLKLVYFEYGHSKFNVCKNKIDLYDDKINFNIKAFYTGVQGYAEIRKKEIENTNDNIYKYFLALECQKQNTDFNCLPLEVIQLIVANLNHLPADNKIYKTSANNSPTFFTGIYEKIKPRENTSNKDEDHTRSCTIL